MAPIILSQPAAVAAAARQTVTLSVEVAAVPDAALQWRKNGKPVSGANGVTLTVGPIRSEDAGVYSVANAHGSVESRGAALTVR
jgi:hypothetical protein